MNGWMSGRTDSERVNGKVDRRVSDRMNGKKSDKVGSGGWVNK